MNLPREPSVTHGTTLISVVFENLRLSEFLDMTVFPEGMEDYIEDEASRRGVAKSVVYKEELASQERARKQAFTRPELERLAAKSKPNPRLLEGDEDCPF
jgi:hypothetical protein